MTKLTAEQKFCPFHANDPTDHINGHSTSRFCYTDQCMAWSNLVEDTDNGYCELIERNK
jgi:hypothetical protein